MKDTPFAEMGYDEQRAFLGLPDTSMKVMSVWAHIARRMVEQDLSDLRAKMARVGGSGMFWDTPTNVTSCNGSYPQA